MSVKLIAYSQGVNGESPEDLLAIAFSKCYQKPVSIEAVLRNLKHESVLEHVSFSFDIEVSRVTWEQIVRHRIASYTAQSHRYTEPKEEDCSFYIPSDVADEYTDEWKRDASLEYQVYLKWRSRGVAKQSARYLLPKGVSIKASWSINLRSLLNFLKLRADAKSQEEIRHFAEQVWHEVSYLFPQLERALEGKFRA